MGQSGSFGNNAVVTRVGEFGDKLWESCVYPNFCHLDHTLMGYMEKALVDELSIDYMARAQDAW